jgi:hypothetical protein
MDIKELEALARAATPGEWEKRNWDGKKWPERRISVASGNTAIVISPRYAGAQAGDDAAYIAAANPQTVLKLIEFIRAQHAIVESVANLGVDSGYGPFNLDAGQPHTKMAIRDARAVLALGRDSDGSI